MLNSISIKNKDSYNGGSNAPVLVVDKPSKVLPVSLKEINQIDALINKEVRGAKLKVVSNQNSRALAELAELYMLKGKYTDALKHYLNIIKIEPSNLKAYDEAIRLYITQSKFKEAEMLFDKLIEASDREPLVLHRYILFYLFFHRDEKDVSEICLKLVNEVLKKLPNNIEVINTKGFILLNYDNKIKEARSYFERALELNPTYIHSLNNLAVCYLRENKFDIAQKKLDKLIEINKYYSGGYENYASLFLQQNKPKKALSYLQDAKKLGVFLTPIWDHKVGWLLLITGQFDEAEKWYLEKIKQEETNYFLHNNLAVIYREKGITDKAIKLFKISAEGFINNFINEDSILPFQNLLDLAYKSDDRSLINWVLKKLKNFNPAPYSVLVLISEIYLERGEYESSKSTYELVLENNPDHEGALIGLSYFYSVLESDFEKTIELLEGKVNDKTQYNIYNNLLYAYTKTNDFSKSKQIINKFKDSKDPLYLANIALFELRANKDLDKALAYFKVAESKMPLTFKPLFLRTKNLELAYYYNEKNNKTKAKYYLNKVDKKDPRLLKEVALLHKKLS
jgi:tetratricopeptide (TPR) repeat protein